MSILGVILQKTLSLRDKQEGNHLDFKAPKNELIFFYLFNIFKMFACILILMDENCRNLNVPYFV